MPKKTKKEKILEFCQIAFNALAVLGLIRLGGVLIDFFTGNKSLIFTLTVGQILQGVLILSMANIMVNHITKNSFDLKGSRLYILVVAIFFTLILLMGYYLKMVVIRLAIWIAVILIFSLFIIAKLIDQKLSNAN
jgi:cobalamin biosynthesis protein CobD/CbiB